MSKICLTLLITCTITLAYSQKKSYTVKDIPLNLLKDAAVIVREHSIEIDIKGTDKSTLTHTKTVTIMSDKGDEAANFYAYYDKGMKISQFEGEMYDAEGKEIKKFSRKDLQDASANYDALTLSQDGRIKVCTPVIPAYPVTIRYAYQEENNNSLGYHSWHPQTAFGEAVQTANFTIHFKDKNLFRIKELNLPNTLKTNHSATHFSWNIENIQAIRPEPLAITDDLFPAVLLAPNDFEYDKTAGNMSTWNKFGQWLAQLYVGRDKLPPDVQKEMEVLADNTPNKAQLIHKIYTYMQHKSRYVSIQLGIGGYQPIPAEKVHELSYGDCKALTNYTKALLNAAGIRSFPVVVKAGLGDERRTSIQYLDFASANQANHIILCVPMDKDTTWLECTSSSLPTGYLSGFTADRNVLLITDNGGIITRTPKYKQEQNTVKQFLRMKVDTNGHLFATDSTIYTGLNYDEKNTQKGYTKQEQDELFKAGLVNAVQLETYELNIPNPTLPQITERASWHCNSFAAVTGRRIQIPIQPFIPDYNYKSLDFPRRTKFEINYPYIAEQTTEIEIPTGYKVEAMPMAINETTKFGKFNWAITEKNKTLTIKQTYTVENKIFEPSDYDAFVQFVQLINKASNSKIILVKE